MCAPRQENHTSPVQRQSPVTCLFSLLSEPNQQSNWRVETKGTSHLVSLPSSAPAATFLFLGKKKALSNQAVLPQAFKEFGGGTLCGFILFPAIRYDIIISLQTQPAIKLESRNQVNLTPGFYSPLQPPLRLFFFSGRTKRRYPTRAVLSQALKEFGGGTLCGFTLFAAILSLLLTFLYFIFVKRVMHYLL